MTTAGRVLLSALFLLGIGSMAWPAEQHRLQVMGRPQVFDVIPATVPYVEITAVTLTSSPDKINGMEQMYGGSTQVIRLSAQEAQALAEKITLWLMSPDEDTLLFAKTIIPPPPPSPNLLRLYGSSCLPNNKGEGQLGHTR